LCCNADGSKKLKPWVIGKSKNPRCFKNINMLTLPCTYSNHKSAWIDAKAFPEWLAKFDRRMVSESRHVLLTLDNCSAHNVTGLPLSNVKVRFFPRNSTSRSQPLDQGIIANLKTNYRSELVRDVIQSIENHNQKPKWDVLQAIRAIASAWFKVKQDTIVNCFRKAWSSSAEQLAPPDAECNTSEPEPREWSLVAPPGCSFDDYVDVDKEAAVSKLTESGDVTEDLREVEADSSSESEMEEVVIRPSKAEVSGALLVMQRFAATNNVSSGFLRSLDDISYECAVIQRASLQQKHMTDFLKKESN